MQKPLTTTPISDIRVNGKFDTDRMLARIEDLERTLNNTRAENGYIASNIIEQFLAGDVDAHNLLYQLNTLDIGPPGSQAFDANRTKLLAKIKSGK